MRIQHGKFVPLTDMLSPKCASPRISPQSEIVRDVPPPPLEVSSLGSSADTTADVSFALLGYRWNSVREENSPPIVSTNPVNIVTRD